MVDNSEVGPGCEFRVTMPAQSTLQELRDDAKKRYGLNVHIRMKIGPTSIDVGGKGLKCPIQVVDDEFLDGTIKVPVPVPGHCLYVGYFLPSDGK